MLTRKPTIRSHGKFLCDIAKDNSGNMLAMSAAGMVVIAALVGGGVDMSRAYMVSNRLQAACDAGVLAGRKAVDGDGFDSDALGVANNYFNANFNRQEQGATTSSFTPTSDDDGNTVNATATAHVDTAVMKIFGKDSFDLSVECSASMGVGNSDVTMVLDTTGSMASTLSGTSQTRIQALRVAMKNFYDTVHTATSSGNARIRYAFVPYSSSVNVGHLISDLDEDYLVDSYAIQSREPVTRRVASQEFDHWGTPVTTTGSGYSEVTNGAMSLYSSTQYNNSNNCNNGIPGNTAFSNNGSSTTDTTTAINNQGKQVVTTTVSQPQRATYYTCAKSGNKWYRYSYYASRTRYSYTYNTSDPVYVTVYNDVFDHWEYKQRTYDVSNYKTFAATNINMGSNGTNISTTWDGCIEERETVSENAFSFSRLTGITPDGAYDLDIDSVPDTGDDATKWAPMWPEAAYYRTAYVSSRWGGSYQISNVTTSTTGGKAGSYCPHEAQLLTEMSEDEFDDYADALKAEGSTYHDLGMIWGARLSSPNGLFATNVTDDPNNGGEVSRHLIFMTDGIMEPNYQIQSTYGIEFHDRRVTDDGYSNDAERHTSRFLAVCEAVKAKGIRVWVIAFSSALTSALQSCASTDSAYTATNATQLNNAFQEIANQVGELRVTL